MKTLFLFLLFISSMQSFAITRNEAKLLLSEKGISLEQLEASGAEVKLGEVTGAGFVRPIEKLEIILLENEAILKRELQSTTFIPSTGQIRHLHSFQAQGTSFERRDIKGVIYRR